MTTASRLAGNLVVLALVFGAAWGVGTALDDPPPAAPPAAMSLGLTATVAGHTLRPRLTELAPGGTGEYAFTITGPDGAVRTDLERPVRLAVARRDATALQHLRPVPGPDGVWRTPLTLPTGGIYRVYADVVPPGGPALVLGADLFVPGEFAIAPFIPSRVAEVDGYQVRLDGQLVPGVAAPVFATVTRAGEPVPDLEPHHGGYGRLVALRRADLALLAVPASAPAPAPGDRAGPGVAFTATLPSPGGYRLFLEFRHAGVVRTVAFTVDVAVAVAARPG